MAEDNISIKVDVDDEEFEYYKLIIEQTISKYGKEKLEENLRKYHPNMMKILDSYKEMANIPYTKDENGNIFIKYKPRSTDEQPR